MTGVEILIAPLKTLLLGGACVIAVASIMNKMGMGLMSRSPRSLATSKRYGMMLTFGKLIDFLSINVPPWKSPLHEQVSEPAPSEIGHAFRGVEGPLGTYRVSRAASGNPWIVERCGLHLTGNLQGRTSYLFLIQSPSFSEALAYARRAAGLPEFEPPTQPLPDRRAAVRHTKSLSSESGTLHVAK